MGTYGNYPVGKDQLFKGTVTNVQVKSLWQKCSNEVARKLSLFEGLALLPRTPSSMAPCHQSTLELLGDTRPLAATVLLTFHFPKRKEPPGSS